MTQRELKFRACYAYPGKPVEMKYNVGVHPFMIFRLSDAELTEQGEYDDNSGDLVVSPQAYTVMQYTGLKDATDKEIYTGDIFSEKWKCEVFQDKNTGAFMVRFHNSPEHNSPETLYEYLSSRRNAGTESRDCVVIGNIYENPELL